MTYVRRPTPATDKDVDSMESFAEAGWQGENTTAKWCHGYMTLVLRIRQEQAANRDLRESLRHHHDNANILKWQLRKTVATQFKKAVVDLFGAVVRQADKELKDKTTDVD